MFLANLSNEQIDLYIDLCIHAANSSESMDDREKQIIKSYCKYIDRDVNDFKAKRNLEEVLGLVEENCNIEIRTTMLVEVIINILLDQRYDSHEQAFIKKVQLWFKIPDEVIGTIFRGVSYVIDGYKVLEEAIGSKRELDED